MQERWFFTRFCQGLLRLVEPFILLRPALTSGSSLFVAQGLERVRE
jgi:hypothetical protein